MDFEKFRSAVNEITGIIKSEWAFKNQLLALMPNVRRLDVDFTHRRCLVQDQCLPPICRGVMSTSLSATINVCLRSFGSFSIQRMVEKWWARVSNRQGGRITIIDGPAATVDSMEEEPGFAC